MLKMLYTDIRNIFYNRGIKLVGLASVVYIIGTLLVSELILKLYDASMSADQIITTYPSIAIFIITSMTLLAFISEYTDGIIKNKLCSGAKRWHIFISAEMSSVLMTFFMTAIIQILTLVLAFACTDGFSNMTPAEVAFSFSETLVASVGIAVFSTSLIMMMGGKNASYVVGLGIAFAFKIVGMEVADKLYPEKGLCQLTGLKLKLYNFYDRFVPYAHCDGHPRWDMASCVIGSVVLIMISVVLGLIVFEKKEIK